MCPVGSPVEGAKLVLWRQKDSQRTLRKNSQMVGKEKVQCQWKSKKEEKREGENFRKEGIRSFKKEGIVRSRRYRRPSEIRTETGSFSLAIMRPRGMEAGIRSQR